ncbi:MAG: hypothetical protein NTV51_10300 [Verrucomicrobia bacterium]|nr:hypothetical protein [Verrucomicrobiota bacterium]
MKAELPLPSVIVPFENAPSTSGSEQDLRNTLNEIRQTLQQLGENYLKLNISSLPITDAKGLAHVLGKSEGTIRRWTEEKLIPCYKIPTGEKFTYLYSLKRVEQELDERYLHEAEV